MNGPVVGVAASGGRDSTALLHATARLARGTGLRVVALHVHHGLMPQADGWQRRLQRQVRRWAAAGLPVDIACRRLTGRPATGDSVEAWARRERYAALAEMAREAGLALVLLAHHRRDQAETVLLQALRGGGPAGLAAMPREALRQGVVWARPWLDQPRERIEAYLRRHRLGHADDPSNEQGPLARARLRAAWPAIVAGFPHAETALASTAARAAEAAACLRELAAEDLARCVDDGGALAVERWQALSPARQGNALRAWLAQVGGTGPSEALLQRLRQELLQVRVGRWAWGRLELRLHVGRLRAADGPGPVDEPGPRLRIDLSVPGEHPVAPWRGSFVVSAVGQGGIAAELLQGCELRPRTGGERWQAATRSIPRSLKKQFQAAGVAAWERQGPLVFAGERLLYVPGLGVDARCVAPRDEVQLALRWQPRA